MKRYDVRNVISNGSDEGRMMEPTPRSAGGWRIRVTGNGRDALCAVLAALCKFKMTSK